MSAILINGELRCAYCKNRWARGHRCPLLKHRAVTPPAPAGRPHKGDR